FIRDDRIKGHEADFAKVNATVTSLPKVGLNPYALGMRMFQHIEEMEDKGRYSFEYHLLKNDHEKQEFDLKQNTGQESIFQIRETMNDFTFINKYIDQEFVSKYKLYVTGKRFNQQRMSWEYYIKSKRAEDYKQMVINTLYHPPDIQVNREKSVNGLLYLNHRFEGKPLKKDFLENTLIGIEYLWGGPVHLETSDPVVVPESSSSYTNFWDPATPTAQPPTDEKPPEIQWKRQLYVMEKRKLHKREL
ncbi:MAG: SpoVR family protein, partial [Desulfobacterales bacterium]|nr:SpoVR family protein [Desulfobacterales bacterium]